MTTRLRFALQSGLYLPQNGLGIIRVPSLPARSIRLLHCLLLAALGLSAPALAPTQPNLVLWAWERPEDLRFAGPDIAIAVLAGTITLVGDTIIARPRRQPLRIAPGHPLIGTVHIEIDRNAHPTWSPAQRVATAAAALSFMNDSRFTELQLDFEIRASERPILLDVLHDLRAALTPSRRLSMTALASWCDTETWLDQAPVDDVVPMLFRMGPGGAPLIHRLARGGDFANPICRRSLGLAVDTPLPAIPPGRRIFIFDRDPWTPDHLAAMRRSLG